MRAHALTQLLRAAWLALPFTAGAALAAVIPTGDGPDAIATALSWVIWAVVMVAVLVLTPVALTVARSLVWTAPTATATALLATDNPSWRGVIGLAVSLLAAVLAWSAPFADDSIDGTAFGDERRFSLRSPGVLVVGILPLVVAIVTVGVLSGPALLWQGNTIVGAVAVVVGGFVAVVGGRSIHQLSRRMLVFVPNGLTLLDPITLAEPVLFTRSETLAFGPAPAETHAVDLSAKALGTPLQIMLRVTDGTAGDGGGVMVSLKTGRAAATAVRVDSILVAPARPGAVLNEASVRRFGTAELDADGQARPTAADS